jgi:hypothetical protein
MLNRLSAFLPAVADSADDDSLHEALRLFSKAYEGRIDELSEKLTEVAKELGKPTLGESVLNYAKALQENVVKAAVDSMVKVALK